MSGVECFLCLSEQDISSLGGHLASYHKISNEANLIMFLADLSQEKRQQIVNGFNTADPEEAVVRVGENLESLQSQTTPPASPKEEIAPMGDEHVTSSPSEREPEAKEQNERSQILTERSEARDEELKLSEKSDTIKKESSLTADIEKPTVPKRPVLKSRTRAVAGEEIKTRKRRSLMMCENLNAVSNRLHFFLTIIESTLIYSFRIQFWKTRGTVEKDCDTHVNVTSEVSISPTERNTERLVNKRLKQQTMKTTEVDDISPFQKPSYSPSKAALLSEPSADDTISMFDDLYTAVCPGNTINMDDHIETNFNLIYDAEEMELNTSAESIGEEVLITPVREERASPEIDVKPLDLTLSTKRCADDDDYEEEVSRQRDISYVSSIVESIEKASRPNETEEGSASRTSTPTRSSDIDKSTCNSLEKVEGMYKCDDCGKDFKFLTYLKGHKSKSGCINSNGKKKRPSMKFSRIIY